MIPALIDLHVRPILNEVGRQDVELLAVQARDHGLDGVVVVGQDEAVDMGDTGPVSQATGVHMFAGVELATDFGPLVCYPRLVDDWFRGAGWKSLPRTDGVDSPYQAAAVVRAFAERGGAVVALPYFDGAEPPLPPGGLTGVMVAAPQLDERAVALAQTARLACVGASTALPGHERFGSAATVFAAPPATQEAMVDGLRSGRVWPAEIGAAVVVAKAPPPQARKQEPRAAPALSQQAPQSQGQRQPFEAPAHAQPARQPSPPPIAEARQARVKTPPVQKVRAKADPYERPGDNRGNRLNRDDVRRKVMPATSDDIQPPFDPVATMYGLDGRKVHRFVGKTDAELDRINGNRSKGSDPNVMSMPLFDELRQERQHINLLFATTAEEDDLEDSVSLRFAMSHLQDGGAGRELPSASQAKRGGGATRRRRR